MSALQSDGGQQLAPNELTFGNFAVLRYNFTNQKFPIKKKTEKYVSFLEPKCAKWHMNQMCAIEPDGGLQLVPIVLIFGDFHKLKLRFCEPRIADKNLGNCFVTLIPKRIKPHYAIFPEKYFINNDPPYTQCTTKIPNALPRFENCRSDVINLKNTHLTPSYCTVNSLLK